MYYSTLKIWPKGSTGPPLRNIVKSYLVKHNPYHTSYQSNGPLLSRLLHI